MEFLFSVVHGTCRKDSKYLAGLTIFFTINLINWHVLSHHHHEWISIFWSPFLTTVIVFNHSDLCFKPIDARDLACLPKFNFTTRGVLDYDGFVLRLSFYGCIWF